MFGYRPPVYRVPFDEAEHRSAGIPARTYPSGSRSGPTSKYPRTCFPHAHPDRSSGFKDVPRNRRENCGQGCPRTTVEPTVAESRTCEGRLPRRTCARVVGARNCPDQREKAVVRGTLVRGHPCPHIPVWFPLRSKSKYPQTGFTHAHQDQSSGFRDVPRNRRETCGQGCPRTKVEPTVAESRTCEGRLPERTCARGNPRLAGPYAAVATAPGDVHAR